jgi:hypothetical protein
MPLHCNEASDGYGSPPKVSLHVMFLARCDVSSNQAFCGTNAFAGLLTRLIRTGRERAKFRRIQSVRKSCRNVARAQNSHSD